MSEHFDEVLAERGMKTPYPRIEPVYSCIDADIRRARDAIIDLEWSDSDDWKLLHNRRLWLRHLLDEKKRGLTRRIVGSQSVKEITHSKFNEEKNPPLSKREN